MKCKKCNKEINLHILGAPEDICYGCLSETEKDEIAEIGVRNYSSNYRRA